MLCYVTPTTIIIITVSLLLASRKTTKEQDDVYSLYDATAVYQLAIQRNNYLNIAHSYYGYTAFSLHYWIHKQHITHAPNTILH